MCVYRLMREYLKNRRFNTTETNLFEHLKNTETVLSCGIWFSYTGIQIHIHLFSAGHIVVARNFMQQLGL